MTDHLPEVRRLRDLGWGNRRIGTELGIGKDAALRLLKKIEMQNLREKGLMIDLESRSPLDLYKSACRALVEARDIVSVKDVADRALAIKEYGRLAADKTLEIDAAELRIEAEIKLGKMLLAAKDIGQVAVGRPKKCSYEEQFRVTLDEAGIDRKLSSRAQKLASISERAMGARLAAWRQAAEKGAGRVTVNLLRGAPINGARSIMGSRVEPDDSLDYFPTPPWATRALCEIVLPHIMGGDGHYFKWIGSVWDPACGEGHMSEVLKEYFEEVVASDVHFYNGNNVIDFFTNRPEVYESDFIITNPPFGDKTIPFILRAIELARVGVAMFLRLQILEGQERYGQIFKPYPPTLAAFFAERVPLCKGRWNPDGGTATAYVWLVWMRDRAPMAPFWIHPGQREALTKEDDRARFAAWSMPDNAEAAE
jgi:hypothetical protein